MSAPASSSDRSGCACTAEQLRRSLQAASTWLDAQADRLNALNVFPVPDGDTGTNMALTLKAALTEALKLDSDHVGEVAKAAARGALMGARGNSGVILSQLLRGFARALEPHRLVGPAELAAAFAEASAVAYRGVSRPVEGTMLTVARLTAEAAAQAAETSPDLVAFLEATLQAAGRAVASTPDYLDVLRKAGVVDSGGEGLRVILEGVWMYATGREIQAATAAPHSAQALVTAAAVEETPFGFCTEFLLQTPDVSVAEIKAAMEGLGESVIAVGDQELVRVHVHTLRPGRALEYAVDHGVLQKVKIENMELQHAEFVASRTGPSRERVSHIGVVAVAAGRGFQQIFTSLGAAAVVAGGQTMNPSVQEIVAAVNSSGYDQIIILPNNPNIVMTANSVKGLTPHQIAVVPTRSLPAGVAALMAFNFEADLETNVELMTAAAQAVRALEVTRAVRDVDLDGVQVKAGQHIAILDGKIVAAARSAERAALQALPSVGAERFELLTIYRGADAAEAEADELAEQVRERYPNLQIEVHHGGQPHYPFILALE